MSSMAQRVVMGTALVAGISLTACRSMVAQDGAASPRFDQAFWDHWSDGLAEVSGYELSYERYGESRSGTAVAIFVTEPFSEKVRVKADPGRPDTDVFPVMKLNLAQDFPTGVYDYNMMTSCFVGLEPIGGRPAGASAKVSFSSQEWCGHVYHQLLFDTDQIRQQQHSYFDGEADQDTSLRAKPGGISEDVLFHWARGMAGPVLSPGESRQLPLLRSIEHVRLRHVPLEWTEVTLERRSDPQSIEVPAGTFQTNVCTATISGGRTWTFHVEQEAPYRIVRWQCTGGSSGQLVRTERIAYWNRKGTDGIRDLEKLGLRPRPPRTP